MFKCNYCGVEYPDLRQKHHFSKVYRIDVFDGFKSDGEPHIYSKRLDINICKNCINKIKEN